MISGFCRGDRIGIALENCPQYVEAASALAKIWVAWVSINCRFKGSKIKFIARDPVAKGFIVDSIHGELIKKRFLI
jgi:acyl-CoA synthetase (AMP-forming)/AMP-acid ligase II